MRGAAAVPLPDPPDKSSAPARSGTIRRPMRPAPAALGSSPALGDTRNCTRSAPLSDHAGRFHFNPKNSPLHRQRLQVRSSTRSASFPPRLCAGPTIPPPPARIARQLSFARTSAHPAARPPSPPRPPYASHLPGTRGSPRTDPPYLRFNLSIAARRVSISSRPRRIRLPRRPDNRAGNTPRPGSRSAPARATGEQPPS